MRSLRLGFAGLSDNASIAGQSAIDSIQIGTNAIGAELNGLNDTLQLKIRLRQQSLSWSPQTG
jgi:hypothetical protein